MTEARYKQLRITNGSILEWIKKSLVLPDDIKIAKIWPGMRDDEFRVILESREYEPVESPPASIPFLVPEFRKLEQKYCTIPEHDGPGGPDSNINPYICFICKLPFKR